MTTVEILTATRALIAEPEHWTTGAYARDRDGREVDHDDPAAVCWCLAGALKKGGNFVENWQIPVEVTDYLHRAGVRSNKTAWNDAKRRTHAQVTAMLDRAIACASAAP